MSDGQTLYLILLFLYLSECFVWIGRRTVVFSAQWCLYWNAKRAGHSLGNLNGGIVSLNPLLPLASAYQGHWCPISLSPIGVCDLNLQVPNGVSRLSQSGQVLLYDQVGEVGHDGKYLLMNGARFSKCATVDQAQLLEKLIRRVLQESPENRGKVIREFIDASLSKSVASARLEEVANVIRPIQWSGSFFFAFLFVFVPAMVIFFGLDWFIIPVAVVMLLFASLIAAQYAWAHRRLYPVRTHDRVSNIVKMALCPPAAIRAGDLLTLASLTEFHPIVIGHLLLGPRAVEFYRPLIRDLHFPLGHNHKSDQVLSILAWQSNAECDSIETFLKTECALTINDFLLPPHWDGVSKAYCPRCLCQLIVNTGECPDCQGVSLQPFLRMLNPEVPNG